MLKTKAETLAGWGHFPTSDCRTYRPEKSRDLRNILRVAPGTLLARGLGRSYGDAALTGGEIIRTERLDHILAFDIQRGIVRAQAGVTLAELMALGIPHGWLPPVIPGTRHVTLGGAFACNVHGKNHWREGEFAEHVTAIRLLTESGTTLECSPNEHADLFWATAGGMGMTGIVEEVTLRLRAIASTSLRTTTYRVASIEDMLAAFEQARAGSDYMVGWIDHTGKDASLGRGVFEAGSHITAGEGGTPLKNFTPPAGKLTVPVYLPAFALNRHVMSLYNRWRFKKYAAQPKYETVDFSGFFHPLDGIGSWNKLYGKRGFFQYQCLLPESESVAAQLRQLLSMIHQKRCFSFLAVLKYHRDGKGSMTFSKQGYSLALDFPNTPAVRDLLPQLDRWVAAQRGRVYLAKDALLSEDYFRAMYPEAESWRELVREIDPGSRFVSRMAERLGWKRAS